ncbi:ATP-binding protein, partial [[Clostridium] innocuum]|nr:ATP-binding protein [[Clostridium] innocuum]
IIALVRAINPQQEVDLMQVDEAYMELSEAINSGKITRITMRRLVDVMMNRDPKLARSLYSLRNDPMARLFFGDDDTDISKVFRLDRPFNLITFAKMPVYSKDSGTYSYDSGNLEHRIFSLILGKVNEITNMFLRMYKGQAKTMLFDEAKLYSTVPGGMSVLVNNNLIARSELCDMLIILQNWSDLPDSIINN